MNVRRRRLAAALTLLLPAIPVAANTAEAASTGVVISQVYGGGGNSGATLTNDFVELFNRGSSPVSLTGWSVQYASSAGTTWSTTSLNGTLQPGQYYLVQQAAGSGGTTPLPTPDAVGTIAMSATSGKVALVAGTGALSGACPTGVVDFVGYGSANCSEGSAAPGLSNTTAALRADDGCTETDDNSADFATGAPNPRNSASPINACVSGPGSVLVINEVMQNPAAVSDGAGEWFEIYNVSGAPIDIDGWTISDNDFDSHVIDAGGSLTVPAGGFVVLGNNADAATNGGVGVDYEYGGGFFLANGADELVLTDPTGVEYDRIQWDGGPVWPDPNGASMNLDPASADTTSNDDGANWCEASLGYGAGDLGTPGSANSDCVVAPPTVTPIHAIQGSGPNVAITMPVRVEAIVTSLFTRDDVLDGFFIQEEDADADTDPMTSEGIFVFCRSNCPAQLEVGDRVVVDGTPTDFFGMSQIDIAFGSGTVSVSSSGNALPAPVAVDLPASDRTDDPATFEPYEGMIVGFTDTLVVSEYFELARYGQLVLTETSRPYQFTHVNEPSASGYTTFLDELAARRIILDDDNNDQNDAISDGPDEPYFWPRPGLSTTNSIRGGDSISGLTGVLHWSFAGQSGTDAWRVRPVDGVDYTFTSNNPRTAAPDDVGGSFTVASFNVLNYFTTIDSRGADSQAELDRQREKIAAAICAMDADVVGLIEIENNGSTAISDLLEGANGVNANCGEYDFIDTGVIGTDEIAVAFIYKTATATPLGDFAVLDSSVDPRFLDSKNRPALAQTFVEVATGGEVTVVVNHLKSKGSPCDDVGDPDANDGQGNCNLTRAAAAEAMVDWLATDPTGAGTNNVLIIGDLNAYRNEDPIDAIEAGADDIVGTDDDFTDLLDGMIGSSAYSFVFDGQLGYLDHALAGAGIVDEVTGVTVWHINADEIPVFDYNDDVRDPGEPSFQRESSALPIYEPNAYRSSDHDPVIVGLDLDAPPVCTAAVPSIDTLLRPNHKMVTVDVLGVTDPEGGPISITIDSIFQDEPVNGEDDGNTAPDGSGVGTSTAAVRAERSGEGNGRVYEIGFTASDEHGNSCSGIVLVSVPLSRNGAPAVNDGALYDSTVVP